MIELSEKSILVVGASGNLGRAISENLISNDANVFVAGRDEAKLFDFFGKTSATMIKANLHEETERFSLVEDVVTLDGFVYAAGISALAPVRYLKQSDFESLISLNTLMPLMLVRELLRKKKLRTQSSIVCLSSIAATSGIAGYSAYSGSKAALEASMRCLAIELAPKKIRVNCVSPGMVAGEMSSAYVETTSDQSLESHFEKYPLGLGEPTDIASAVSFLLSDNSRWITGTTIPVDGGYSAR
ncbi:MAG: SDR family oxidoreductase [Verrucomicrobiota bacterium]